MFHLKSSDIKIFVLAFWPRGLIRKTRLIQKFITLQRGQQTIAIHILFNNSRSKSIETMKFAQFGQNVIKEIFLFKNHARNKAGTLL